MQHHHTQHQAALSLCGPLKAASSMGAQLWVVQKQRHKNWGGGAAELVTAKMGVGGVLDVGVWLSMSMVVIKIFFGDHGTGRRVIAHAFHAHIEGIFDS